MTSVEASDFTSFSSLQIVISTCDEKFDMSVYRKPIFTDLLLHFNSIASFSWKRRFITCLLHRANSY